MTTDPCTGHGPYAAPQDAPTCPRCGYPTIYAPALPGRRVIELGTGR